MDLIMIFFLVVSGFSWWKNEEKSDPIKEKKLLEIF